MTPEPSTEARGWRRRLARAFAFGAGAALILIAASLGRSWWLARPVPWNDRALRASLTALSNVPDNNGGVTNVVFNLAVTNDTDVDYRVQPSRQRVMLRQGRALQFARNAILDIPPVIPAHDSVYVNVTVPTGDLFEVPSKDTFRIGLDDIDWEATIAEREKEDREKKNQPRTVHEETAAFLPRSLNALVILDEALHYRIIVTKQW